jgi:hypothetical protein
MSVDYDMVLILMGWIDYPALDGPRSDVVSMWHPLRSASPRPVQGAERSPWLATTHWWTGKDARYARHQVSHRRPTTTKTWVEPVVADGVPPDPREVAR